MLEREKVGVNTQFRSTLTLAELSVWNPCVRAWVPSPRPRLLAAETVELHLMLLAYMAVAASTSTFGRWVTIHPTS